MGFATVVVGAPRARTDQEIIMESEWARALLSQKNFGLLVTDTADRLTLEWSVAKDSASREAAYYKLEGLRALVRELQTKVDQGLLPSKGNSGRQDTNP